MKGLPTSSHIAGRVRTHTHAFFGSKDDLPLLMTGDATALAMASLAEGRPQASDVGVSRLEVTSMDETAGEIGWKTQARTDPLCRIMTACTEGLVMAVDAEIESPACILFMGAHKVGRMSVITQGLEWVATEILMATLTVHLVIVFLVIMTT